MTEVLEPTLTRPVDDAALATLFTEAHTINSFAPTPVTDAQLAEIWNLAKWAPTAANLQPLRVVFPQSPDARQRLVRHLHEGNRAKTLAAPAVALLAFDKDFHELAPRVVPVKPELRDQLAANDDARYQLGRFNGALQAGYFILAARALGLGAGPMGGFDPVGLDAEFFPEGDRSSILVVNLGHPADTGSWYPRLPRLEQAEVLRWE
ncbi:malonic semialdehyde reductase [Microlunatus speluncae]|uniref:malonic semialdehyde reductase n=1 Tax=Microlunatus speluncae TaxID=2594267 RepID=UPI0012664ED2|nr:malonic semialdehyde reductase [Microlunatus speluncae]